MYILEDSEDKILVDKIRNKHGEIHFRKLLKVIKLTKSKVPDFWFTEQKDNWRYFSDEEDFRVKITEIKNKLGKVLYS